MTKILVHCLLCFPSRASYQCARHRVCHSDDRQDVVDDDIAIALGRDDVRAQSQGCQRTYGQTWNGTTIACLQRRRTGHEDEVAIVLVAREDAVENDREVGRDEEERAEAEH